MTILNGFYFKTNAVSKFHTEEDEETLKAWTLVLWLSLLFCVVCVE